VSHGPLKSIRRCRSAYYARTAYVVLNAVSFKTLLKAGQMFRRLVRTALKEQDYPARSRQQNRADGNASRQVLISGRSVRRPGLSPKQGAARAVLDSSGHSLNDQEAGAVELWTITWRTPVQA